MLKVNKKLLKRVCAFALVGTCLLSATGCSNGIADYPDDALLEGKYSSGGYYLSDTSFDGLLVIESDGKLKIIDEDLKSVYSNDSYDNSNYDSSTVQEVYKFLDSELLAVNELTNKDYINIEKHINGEDVEQLSDLKKVDYKDLIIDDGKYYRKNNGLYYQADLSEIEVLFLDGKADRIVRRLKEGNPSGRTIDIISGAIVHPSWEGGAKTSTFDYYSRQKQGYTEYEFVPISDLFPEIIKTKFTGDEAVKLYYLIQGRTKDEVKGILTVYNQILPTNEQTSIEETENVMVKK